MESRGSGTDHNLRVEERSMLRGKHVRRLVAKVTRPLMYACGKCGYIEFYVQKGLDKTTKNEAKAGGRYNGRKRTAEENHQYFT